MKTAPVRTEAKSTDRRYASVFELLQKEKVSSEIRAKVAVLNAYTFF